MTIEGMEFHPPVMTVRRGERITWVNKDFFPHTVTSDRKGFDSGDIAPNGRWSLVATTAGDFAYSCRLHPTMRARLNVR